MSPFRYCKKCVLHSGVVSSHFPNPGDFTCRVSTLKNPSLPRGGGNEETKCFYIIGALVSAGTPSSVVTFAN